MEPRDQTHPVCTRQLDEIQANQHHIVNQHNINVTIHNMPNLGRLNKMNTQTSPSAALMATVDAQGYVIDPNWPGGLEGAKPPCVREVVAPNFRDVQINKGDEQENQ